ncbi:MAG: hypothetical protein HF314_12020 [Ignavibacteria bacterium]|jgi:hypothetical protein|nr:hypothetical protein [Ignavibacteria bacterium]MCU7503797.1 hypothetical protein [Ignavibacteria bacterium]MCU7517189.1 hypothetical protein [Ignavibacteria bacterium]
MKRLAFYLAFVFATIMAVTLNVQAAPDLNGSPPGRAILIEQDALSISFLTFSQTETFVLKEQQAPLLRLKKKDIQIPAKTSFLGRHECLRSEIPKRKYFYTSLKGRHFNQANNFLSGRPRDKPGYCRLKNKKIPPDKIA